MSLLDRQLHPGWHKKAACLEQTDLMFSTVAADVAKARRLCSTCAVRTPCLASALLHREPDGIWGGFSTDERSALIRRLPDGNLGS